MNLKLISGLIASFLAIVCFIPYFRDIYKKTTEPHAYSWLIWTILQVVAVIAQLKDGSGYGSLALAIGSFFCFLVFILSLRYGTKNINKFDKWCLIASLITIVLYITLKNPVWSVILITTTDFVAFLPTFRKGYEEPESETPITFAIAAISEIFSLMALGKYTMTTVLYLASLLITNSVMMAIVYVRRAKK
jgi:hypothetical protein